MAKVVTVDDYPLYAKMMADLLRDEGGHEVKDLISPLPLDELLAFGPQVLVVTLVRKLEALGHGPLHDFYTEVDGARAFRELVTHPQTAAIPIVVAAIGVLERDIPKELRYKAMIHVPQELDLLPRAVGLTARSGETDVFEA